jgi:pyruvate dehydrogenase E1 component beta subunit
MERDDRIVLLGEDVGKDRGVFRLPKVSWRCSVRNGSSIPPWSSRASWGPRLVWPLRPEAVAEIQFLGFIYPAFDQIFSHAARYRSRSRGRFSCPM